MEKALEEKQENLIKGVVSAKSVKAQIKEDVAKAKEAGVTPKLAVVLVGEDPASVWYAKSKIKVGEKLGLSVDLREFPQDTPEQVVLDYVHDLNEDKDVHGILVELPLPKNYNKNRVMNAVSPHKDVDGFTTLNRGLILEGREDEALIPATPLACIHLIEQAGLDLKGKRVTLVGRGDTVGRPLAFMLINRHATLTLCHSKTEDLKAACLGAEVVVAAVGVPHLVKGDWVAEGAVVIDAGINEVAEGEYTGDVEFDAAVSKASAITPVPGGVGSLTTSIIMANTIKAMKLQKEN